MAEILTLDTGRAYLGCVLVRLHGRVLCAARSLLRQDRIGDSSFYRIYNYFKTSNGLTAPSLESRGKVFFTLNSSWSAHLMAEQRRLCRLSKGMSGESLKPSKRGRGDRVTTEGLGCGITPRFCAVCSNSNPNNRNFVLKSNSLYEKTYKKELF